jgi:nucleotide-binding universal stress UspA family protein
MDANPPVLSAAPHREVGEPVHAISTLACQLDIELVVIGHSRQQSCVMRWWRGSIDTLLIAKISCAVLIAPKPR